MLPAAHTDRVTMVAILAFVGLVALLLGLASYAFLSGWWE